MKLAQKLTIWNEIIQLSKYNYEIIEDLFKQKFNGYTGGINNLINVCDSNGDTLLHRAVAAKNQHMVGFLIENGADENIPNNDGELYNGSTSYALLKSSVTPRAWNNFEGQLTKAREHTQRFVDDPLLKQVILSSSRIFCNENAKAEKDKSSKSIKISGAMENEILPETVTVPKELLSEYFYTIQQRGDDRKDALTAVYKLISSSIKKDEIDPLTADILYESAKNITLDKLLSQSKHRRENLGIKSRLMDDLEGGLRVNSLDREFSIVSDLDSLSGDEESILSSYIDDERSKKIPVVARGSAAASAHNSGSSSKPTDWTEKLKRKQGGNEKEAKKFNRK